MPNGMPPRSAKLAASILSADLARLADQVKAVEADLDMIHVDNMDAHFVPPLCLGAVVVASLRQATELPLHCHLMVERPVELLRDFAEAGADIVSMHVEAADEPERAVKEAAAQGLRAGLAVSPQTPVETVFPFLEDLDRVLVMSVRPGMVRAGLPGERAAEDRGRPVRDRPAGTDRGDRGRRGHQHGDRRPVRRRGRHRC